MPIVVKHVADLGGSDPRPGKRRNIVLSKEVNGRGLDACPRRAPRKLAEEEELVGVKRKGGMAMELPVINRRELLHRGFIAGLLAHLAQSGDTGCITHVSPAARQRPGIVDAFLHQQDPTIVKQSGTHVYLWSRVSKVALEKLYQRF